MNDSMPRGLGKTHFVYHRAKPVSISTPEICFLEVWHLSCGTFWFWSLWIPNQICFISRVLDFCPGNAALFQLRNIWGCLALHRHHHHCNHHTSTGALVSKSRKFKLGCKGCKGVKGNLLISQSPARKEYMNVIIMMIFIMLIDHNPDHLCQRHTKLLVHHHHHHPDNCCSVYSSAVGENCHMWQARTISSSGDCWPASPAAPFLKILSLS